MHKDLSEPRQSLWTVCAKEHPGVSKHCIQPCVHAFSYGNGLRFGGCHLGVQNITILGKPASTLASFTF